MEVLYQRCAGLDVHKGSIHVSVLIGTGRKRERIRFKVGTFHRDLVALRDRLVELKVEAVLMESTGVYWMPVYDVLEGSMVVVVANAQHIMNVPGRKTDDTDADWLAELLRHGLVKPSFVPPREFRELRELTRYRRSLVRMRASEQNRIEKHLQSSGIKLSSVTQIDTVSVGRMLSAIAEGNTSPEELANMAVGQLRKKIPQLQAALEGSISPHTQAIIQKQLTMMHRFDCSIAELELHIDNKTTQYQRLINKIDALPGIEQRTAIDILAETGCDMSPWKTHRQFAAMAGLCPANFISAGKRLKNGSRRGNPYLKSIMVQAAASAINTNGTYYQYKYRKLKERRGHKRALMAIAHSMLVAIYHMIKYDKPYEELGADFKSKEDPGRRTRYLIGQLKKLGVEVTINQQN